MSYDYITMPNVLDVRCPGCQSCAKFEFATCRQIKRNSDLSYFEKSKDFVVFREFSNGYRNVAYYFSGLARRTLDLITDLPSGYSADDWRPAYAWCRRSDEGEVGTVRCHACFAQRKHILAWPADAFFQIELKGQVLWAFDRTMAADVLTFVSSNERRGLKSSYDRQIRKIPKIFVERKSRSIVEQRLRKLLAGGRISKVVPVKKSRHASVKAR